MRFIIGLAIAAACFGQGKHNVVQTGIVDAHGASWRFPESTFAGLPTPAAGNTGWRYTVTDCLSSGCTAGGGSVPADVRSTGSAWVVISGGGGGGAAQASIFSGGTLLQQAVECSHGTTSYSALTAAAPSQELTIQSGISGNVRYASVIVSETTQFAGTTGLTVAMGRPGSTTHAEMTNGINFPLMVSSGDLNYASTRPIPPQITSTYNIVLNFAATAGNVNAATAGSLTWEICGYAAR
jgi:hypothetical protein